MRFPLLETGNGWLVGVIFDYRSRVNSLTDWYQSDIARKTKVSVKRNLCILCYRTLLPNQPARPVQWVSRPNNTIRALVSSFVSSLRVAPLFFLYNAYTYRKQQHGNTAQASDKYTASQTNAHMSCSIARWKAHMEKEKGKEVQLTKGIR